MKHKFIKTVTGVLTVSAVGVSAANAALDFAPLTAAVDASTIVAAIGVIAGVKMLPGVAKWGYSKVIGWFR